MQTFRIFTNDRGTRRGVRMYSCLKEVEAADPEGARQQCSFAGAVAIHWPASAQSDDEKAWVKKHVG